MPRKAQSTPEQEEKYRELGRQLAVIRSVKEEEE